MTRTPTAKIDWPRAYRILSSREPPIAAFTALVDDPLELEELLEVEALTNPIARLARMGIADIPISERVTGDGASLIMPPFVLPTSSRFSDGSYGVFYAGDELETAGIERAHRLAIEFKRSHETEIVLRAQGWAYSLRIDAVLHDLRRSASPAPTPGIYNPSDYTVAQKQGRSLKLDGSNGVIYESVRRPQHECAGVFRPTCIASPRFEKNVYFDWDGGTVTFASSP